MTLASPRTRARAYMEGVPSMATLQALLPEDRTSRDLRNLRAARVFGDRALPMAVNKFRFNINYALFANRRARIFAAAAHRSFSNS